MDRSEIEAEETPHFSKGYWSRTLDYLKILTPEQAMKLHFSSGVPIGIESSIYSAATRKRLPVSVYVRGPAVYICNNPEPAIKRVLSFPRQIHCRVCHAQIDPRLGTGKQYVCAGTKKKKSECQKIWRYRREHGISIEEAKQSRIARALERRRG